MTNDKQRERLVELLDDAEYKNLDYEMANKFYPFDDYKSHSEFVADYLLANGVIVPPCKVGDKVYYFSKNPINLSVQANTIYEADVVRIVTTYLGTSLVIQIHNEYGCTEIPSVDEWGITVFLTKEEAEKALGGVQG